MLSAFTIMTISMVKRVITIDENKESTILFDHFDKDPIGLSLIISFKTSIAIFLLVKHSSYLGYI